MVGSVLFSYPLERQLSERKLAVFAAGFVQHELEFAEVAFEMKNR